MTADHASVTCLIYETRLGAARRASPAGADLGGCNDGIATPSSVCGCAATCEAAAIPRTLSPATQQRPSRCPAAPGEPHRPHVRLRLTTVVAYIAPRASSPGRALCMLHVATTPHHRLIERKNLIFGIVNCNLALLTGDSPPCVVTNSCDQGPLAVGMQSFGVARSGECSHEIVARALQQSRREGRTLVTPMRATFLLAAPDLRLTAVDGRTEGAEEPLRCEASPRTTCRVRAFTEPSRWTLLEFSEFVENGGFRYVT